MFAHRSVLLSASVLILSLSGCGTQTIIASAPHSAVTPAATPLTVSPAPSASAVILEPGAGTAPWVSLIDHAHTGLDLNGYLIDNPAILAALRQAGQRGVPIHVLLAPNPYDDTAAVPAERQVLAQVPDSTVRNAPTRFDQAYAFDHAKYLVINPGTAQVTAIIGSPNFTDSAFDGTNLEAAATVTGSTAQAAAQVFQADWTDQSAGSAPRHQLVLSPGAAATWLRLLQSAGPIEMTAEEIGDDSSVLAAMAAKGSALHLLCPAPSNAAAQARLATLAAAGVQIRTLTAPYVHAKTLITTQTAFLGSQNLSSVSLHDNREMGVLVSGGDRAALATWFQHWWAQATPWTPTTASAGSPGSPTTPPTSPASSARPWLPQGASMTTVRHLWGAPVRTYPTTYQGQAQTAWIYSTATVYFVQQHVVDVSDQS